MDKSNIDKLMELKQLYEAGVLTKEEMEVEKKKILGQPAPDDKGRITDDIETTGPSVNDTMDKSPDIEDNQSPQMSDSTTENVNVSFFKKYRTYILLVIGILSLCVLLLGIKRNSSSNQTNDNTAASINEVDSIDSIIEAVENEKKKNAKRINDFYSEQKNKGNLSLVKFLRNDDVKNMLIDKYNPNYYNSVMTLMKKNGDIGNVEVTSDGTYKGHANIYPRETGVDPYDDWAVDFSYNPTYDQLELKATVFNIPLKSDGSINEDGIKKEIERLNEEARKKEASEIEAVESQAISIGKVIDAYNNNIDGRADNMFYKKEKVYKFKLKTIRKSSSDYEYVMEGYGFGERSNESVEFYVYTDDYRLTGLNFPVTLCFRGSLVSIEEDRVTSTYHFICYEALTYKY